MNRLSIKELTLNFIFLMLLQLPLIYRVTLFNRAFGFFYVGFLLLLPTSLNRSYLMLIGFLCGLSVDIFTNTPGIHSFSCVFIMFVRKLWLSIVNADWQELVKLDISTLNKIGFLIYLLPLVFVHHLLLFTIENGGFYLFGMLMTKVFFSSTFSFVVIFAVNYLLQPNKGR